MFQDSSWDNTNFRLPLRFVWGVLPVDNGDYLEPNSKGTLQFDSSFDISSPESQVHIIKPKYVLLDWHLSETEIVICEIVMKVVRMSWNIMISLMLNTIIFQRKAKVYH